MVISSELEDAIGRQMAAERERQAAILIAEG